MVATVTTAAGAGAATTAGLFTFFFFDPDTRVEDGEERLPSPSLLHFLDGREEAAGIL
jgi:hypothetical protein